jgi:hypothetical protein
LLVLSIVWTASTVWFGWAPARQRLSSNWSHTVDAMTPSCAGLNTYQEIRDHDERVKRGDPMANWFTPDDPKKLKRCGAEQLETLHTYTTFSVPHMRDVFGAYAGMLSRALGGVAVIVFMGALLAWLIKGFQSESKESEH